MTDTAPLTTVHLNSERGWRGGERQTLWLAAALQRAGHRALVVARAGGPLARRAAEAGLDVRALGPLAPVDPLTAWRLRRLMAAERADVLHAHTGNAHSLALLAAVGTRTALVASKRVDRGPHAGSLTRAKFRHTDAVIAVSAAIRDTLVAGGVAPGRVAVVNDGVDTGRPMTPDTRRLAAIGARPGVRPVVLLVAALVPTKDPVGFVRAVAAARRAGAEFDAVIAGDGPLRPAVAAEREALGLTDVLHLAGWQEETDGLVAAADVVVLSSVGEGLGSILLDAMLCARPVAATAVGGVSELVAAGVTGLLVPPSDPDALGAAIARLVTDPALRARLGAAARARVSAFAVDRMAEATLAVYRAAIGHRRSGRKR